MSDLKIPLQVTPDQAASEAAALADKMARGAKLFSEVRDDDVAIATTPKDEVWRQDKVVLYRYRPLTDQKVRTPVLITYGLIGRYTMADLQEDRSLVRNLLNLGIDLYVVDWGNPSRADRWLTIDDYVDDYIAGAVDVIRERADIGKVNLLGICEGGVFALCYAALYPEAVRNLVLTITPVDFHGDQVESRLGHGFINLWTRSLDPETIDRLIEAHGNLPGEFMGSVFSMMTPMRTLMKYNLDMLEVMDDQKKFLNFLRMEKWIADRPHHPGEAAKQWLKDLYQDNKLIRNEFELGGRKVDLGKVTMPVLNVFARDDHIIPPATSQGLKLCVGSKDYRELPLPGGHVGVFVGGKSQGLLGSGIADWLGERDAEPPVKSAAKPPSKPAKKRAGAKSR
jgi:polyhydroxyalkanoate synthase subunit PhaC